MIRKLVLRAEGVHVINCLRICVLASALPLLHGCAAAMMIGQVAPALLQGAAIATAEDRSPFRIEKTNARPRLDAELAELDAQIKQAECGNAQSQFWLAAALQNGFNTTPDTVEIYKWYRLAEIGEFAPAAEQRVALEATMSEAELVQAKGRVQGWQATTEGCELSG